MPDIQEPKCFEFTVKIFLPPRSSLGAGGNLPPLDLFLYINAHGSLFILILDGTPCKNKFWS